MGDSAHTTHHTNPEKKSAPPFSPKITFFKNRLAWFHGELNSPYFPQKISTCHVLCWILTRSASRVAWAYLELLQIKINILFSRPRRAFLKLYVDCMRKCREAMKIEPSEIGFSLVTFSGKYFDHYFYVWIVASRETRRSSPCAAGSVRKKLKLLWPCGAFFGFSEYY